MLLRCLMVSNRERLSLPGKYEKSNHIEPHDDRAYADVYRDGKVKVQCSRDIAVIYYLTKDWSASYGGHLIDIPTGEHACVCVAKGRAWACGACVSE